VHVRDERSRRERAGTGRLDDRSEFADADAHADAHAGAQPATHAHADSDARAREHPRADARDRHLDEAIRPAERPGPAVR
jgi:hypothetical protein